MRPSLLAAAILLCVSGAARAADPQIIQSPSIDPERFGWSGAYVGATVGYAWLEDVDYSFTPPFRDKGEDWIFGGHVGYLHQFGNFVVGAEFEAMKLDIAYENFDFITVEDAYVAKARVGFAIDRFLISGHGGAVYATTNFAGLKDWGWAAGAGVDYALTDNIIVGAQYTRFGFTSFDGTQIDADIDTVTARVSFKF